MKCLGKPHLEELCAADGLFPDLHGKLPLYALFGTTGQGSERKAALPKTETAERQPHAGHEQHAASGTISAGFFWRGCGRAIARNTPHRHMSRSVVSLLVVPTVLTNFDCTTSLNLSHHQHPLRNRTHHQVMTHCASTEMCHSLGVL